MFAAPDNDIKEAAKLYFELGMRDVDIVEHLKDHYNTEEHGLRCLVISDILSPS